MYKLPYLLIIRKPSNLEIDILRKQTTNDKTINFLSNHSIEHKVAAFIRHITRMHSLSLTPKRRQKEGKLIQLIAQNNFPQKLLRKLNFQIQQKQTNQDQNSERNKNKTWTKFIYYRPIIRKINNLFKHTDVGRSFKNINTLQQLTKPKIVNNTQEQDNRGICKIICSTRKMPCIGQTSRSLKQKYQEHIRYIKQNGPQSLTS